MKIKCLKCNDIIESKSVHDLQRCKCGACFIDGGDFKNIHWVYEDGHEAELQTEIKKSNLHTNN